MKNFSLYGLFFFLLIDFQIFCQQTSSLPINPELLKKEWSAKWISHPSASRTDYGVFHFRNTVTLTEKPDSFIIHVSADNRYRLFVNGKPIGFGPARGDIAHWRFETYDIAPYLTEGKNVISSMVWNIGNQKPLAQQSIQTAFIVQGNSSREDIINTGNDSWKVVQNKAYFPVKVNSEMVHGYYASGACDSVIASSYPWGWENLDFVDQSWQKPMNLGKGEPSYYRYGYGNNFGLTPRTIPFMEEKQERFTKIARTSKVLSNSDFIKGGNPLIIPKKTKVSILLDLGQVTIGYPEMLFNGGKSSKIKISYSEALFNNENKKGHRDSISGKEIKGYYDVFVADGKGERMFRPLWMRTFRYVQIDIQTGNFPLTILDYYNMFTAYPFEENGSFTTDDKSFTDIWNVSWRTARLCASETYFDCPYYEQLQYIGDTRIQAMISYYVSGDDRLAKNAISQFYNSRIPEGITMSRYPTDPAQVIPPFSLVWIGMVHDFYTYRNDPEFVKQFLPAIQSVLGWFESKMNKQKEMLGPLDWWNFTDWSAEFKRGVPSGAEDGNSAIISLQFAHALDYATELFYNFGKKEQAKTYSDLSYALKKAVYKACFDANKRLIADTPEKKMFSQHANILGILTDAIPLKDQKVVMQRLLSDTSLIQSTIYYRFYLNRALKKTGLGNLYVECLEPWRKMLNDGLTTFAETDIDPRSDCHAWSASPNFDLLSIVCGIEPATYGFEKVEISPNLGILNEVSGKMPHPLGEIMVTFRKNGKKGISGEITLPEGLNGYFNWNGKSIPIKSGVQSVEL